ncbi:hypothetical protein Q8A67_014375 [Cirrhinus molitorella]|uniref:Uncharacterized protein n=1 Tax=Cirrhinus molitorella TaxID=172907 RepID=A0AA88TJP1_9TELE|nr:hypothetical protein Q8A67_014375 [Cirrhinus molitorella]
MFEMSSISTRFRCYKPVIRPKRSQEEQIKPTSKLRRELVGKAGLSRVASRTKAEPHYAAEQRLERGNALEFGNRHSHASQLCRWQYGLTQRPLRYNRGGNGHTGV